MAVFRILDKLNFSPESSIWKYPHPSSSALVEDFKRRGRGCVLWHRVTFAGSCSQWEVPTPSKECSACFMSFRGTWRTVLFLFFSMKFLEVRNAFPPKIWLKLSAKLASNRGFNMSQLGISREDEPCTSNSSDGWNHLGLPPGGHCAWHSGSWSLVRLVDLFRALLPTPVWVGCRLPSVLNNC